MFEAKIGRLLAVTVQLICAFVFAMQKADFLMTRLKCYSIHLNTKINDQMTITEVTALERSVIKYWKLKPVLQIHIRITCPYVLYPLKPHFYIVKLGFTGVYIIFLFLLLNIYCGYSF